LLVLRCIVLPVTTCGSRAVALPITPRSDGRLGPAARRRCLAAPDQVSQSSL